jgi:Pyruvate/2-oxoacid:ferredoxin oxidoreductase gamma subunit
VIYDRSVVPEPPDLPDALRVLGIPATEMARDLGAPLVKNIVALGALQGATHLLPEETFLTALRQALRDKGALLSLNEQAFRRGVEAVGAP